MTKLAKQLKKEKVSVDIINFGENESNQQLLSEFIDVLNGKDGTGSHLISVPPGSALKESILSSPIVGGSRGGQDGGNLGIGIGLDENEDPDLQYALRISMENQRMRMGQEENAAAGGNTALPGN